MPRGDQVERGVGCRSSLVALIDRRPRPRLIAILASQNTRPDGQNMAQSQDMQSANTFLAHMFVMGGFTANYTAERHVTGEGWARPGFGCGNGVANDLGNFHRARNCDSTVGPAPFFYSGDGACHELIGDILVESRFDDENRGSVGHDADRTPVIARRSTIDNP